jgi:hypothetical protein
MLLSFNYELSSLDVYLRIDPNATEHQNPLKGEVDAEYGHRTKHRVPRSGSELYMAWSGFYVDSLYTCIHAVRESRLEKGVAL